MSRGSIVNWAIAVGFLAGLATAHERLAILSVLTPVASWLAHRALTACRKAAATRRHEVRPRMARHTAGLYRPSAQS